MCSLYLPALDCSVFDRKMHKKKHKLNNGVSAPTPATDLHLSPYLRDMLLAREIDPPEHWFEFEKPPILVCQRVSTADVVRHIAHCYRSGDATFSKPRWHLTPRNDWQARSTVKLMPHQHDAIAATVAQSPVRSGIWLLPCGTGKTLAAAALCASSGRPSFWAVPNMETAKQCQDAFRRIGIHNTVLLGADASPPLPSLLGSDETRPRAVFATWKAVALHVKSPVAEANPVFLAAIECCDYGFCILDEAHIFPANTHMDAVRAIHAAATVGMTASLSRSDNKDNVTITSIGDILYELTLQDAEKANLVAKVRRIHVHVPMDEDVQALYDRFVDADAKRLVALFNPNKLAALVRMLTFETNNKVIVYIDKVCAVPIVHKLLSASTPDKYVIGFLTGATCSSKRVKLVNALRSSDAGCLIMSRCGSASIDVQDLDAVFEVDVTDAAEQKNLQRIGRAQRLHARKHMARFYTFVSANTREVHFVNKRMEYTCHDVETIFTESMAYESKVPDVPGDASEIAAFVEKRKPSNVQCLAEEEETESAAERPRDRLERLMNVTILEDDVCSSADPSLSEDSDE